MASSFHLNERAVSRIAEAAAMDVPGCLRIDAKLAGLASRGLPRVESRINRVASSVVVEVEIATAFPAPIANITEVVREAITKHIQAQTGLEVTRVDITVADTIASGSLSPAGRVTREEVASHPTFFVTTPITVTASRVSAPVTAPRKELVPVEVSPLLKEVRSPTMAPRVFLRPIETPPPVALKQVEAPKATAARSVKAPKPLKLRDITVSQTRATSRSVAAAPVEVRHVRRPSPSPVYIPRAPQPQPLRPVTINPAVKYLDL
ncbi:Asp23/Gls24 family envelope stress response protein [Corynebacterium mayonis]|uniref:Asp23/Gls24 family envelope stress response protein n=1 Tax=Corynebacterium mayonis TaxID=3062461 RepID=UPI003140C378